MWTPPINLIEFCESPYARKGCFSLWPRERIVDYLQHHHEQQTLGIVLSGEEILAVGTGAQCNPATFSNPYLRDTPLGTHLFLETLIVTEPGCFCGLVSTMLFRWPHWRTLQITGRRKGKIVYYEQRVIEKFVSIGWRGLAPVPRVSVTYCRPVPITVPA